MRRVTISPAWYLCAFFVVCAIMHPQAVVAQPEALQMPVKKELWIRKNIDDRGVSTLADVQNSIIVLDMENDNYLKGKLMQLFRSAGLRHFKLILNDRITKSHVRQIRYLRDFELEVRLTKRFLTDKDMKNRIMSFGPVRLTLVLDKELLAYEGIWTEVAKFKNVSVSVEISEHDVSNMELAARLAARPGWLALEVRLDFRPEPGALEWLSASKANQVAIPVQGPDDLRWKFIDWLHEKCSVPVILEMPPVRVDMDFALRIQGIEPILIRVKGAANLNKPGVEGLNSIHY